MSRYTSVFVIMCMLTLGMTSIIGPKGPKGERGYPGPPGPPGICSCDYNNNNNKKTNIINNKKIIDNINREEKAKHLGSSSHQLNDGHLHTDNEVETKEIADAAQYKAEFDNIKEFGYNKDNANKDLKQKQGFKASINEEEFERIEEFEDENLDAEFKVDFTENVKKRFEESFGDEGHRGKYTGNEFDISNSLHNKQGTYEDNLIENEVKASKYADQENNINRDVYGKFNENRYDKHNDEDADTHIRRKNSKYGVPDDEYDYNNDYNLYDSYKGNEKGKRPKGPKGPSAGGRLRNYETERAFIDKENDERNRKYGNEFDDSINEKSNAYIEGNFGQQFKGNNKRVHNKEEYRDINNKGKNKFAEYEGDYNNRKKYHNLDDNTEVDIDLHQIDTFEGGFIDGEFVGAQGFDTKVSERKETRGKRVNADFDAYNQFEGHKDNEFVRKKDGKRYNDKFNGKDEYRKREDDREKDIYFDKKKKDNRDARFARFNRDTHARKLLGNNDFECMIEVGRVKNDIRKLYCAMAIMAVVIVMESIHLFRKK